MPRFVHGGRRPFLFWSPIACRTLYRSWRQGCRTHTRRLALLNSSRVVRRLSETRALSSVCSFLFPFCFGEIRRRIPAQVSLQEILSFRQRDTIITLALDLQTQICPAALQ